MFTCQLIPAPSVCEWTGALAPGGFLRFFSEGSHERHEADEMSPVVGFERLGVRRTPKGSAARTVNGFLLR